MGWFGDVSVGRKLTLLTMVTSCSVLLLTCMAVAVEDAIDFRRITARELQSIADIVGANSVAPLTFNDAQSARDVLAGLAAEPRISAACVYRRDGEPFAV